MKWLRTVTYIKMCINHSKTHRYNLIQKPRLEDRVAEEGVSSRGVGRVRVMGVLKHPPQLRS